MLWISSKSFPEAASTISSILFNVFKSVQSYHKLSCKLYELVSELMHMFPSVRPSEIEYLEIRVHNAYHEDLIELNPRMSAFFKLEDV